MQRPSDWGNIKGSGAISEDYLINSFDYVVWQDTFSVYRPGKTHSVYRPIGRKPWSWQCLEPRIAGLEVFITSSLISKQGLKAIRRFWAILLVVEEYKRPVQLKTNCYLEAFQNCSRTHISWIYSISQRGVSNTLWFSECAKTKAKTFWCGQGHWRPQTDAYPDIAIITFSTFDFRLP